MSNVACCRAGSNVNFSLLGFFKSVWRNDSSGNSQGGQVFITSAQSGSSHTLGVEPEQGNKLYQERQYPLQWLVPMKHICLNCIGFIFCIIYSASHGKSKVGAWSPYHGKPYSVCVRIKMQPKKEYLQHKNVASALVPQMCTFLPTFPAMRTRKLLACEMKAAFLKRLNDAPNARFCIRPMWM